MLKTVDLWRVQFPTKPDAAPDELLSDRYIQDRLQRLHAREDDYDVHHRTLYRVHQRVAETYRVARRVLLAGDAAHVNNPLGGMGMNGGIHDAFSLGEKIVQILTESASLDERLDLYNQQRRGICIEFIQARTQENKRVMETRDAAVQDARRERLRQLTRSQEEQDQYILETSMIQSLRDCQKIRRNQIKGASMANGENWGTT